jgi:hypothetical protein
MSSKEVIGSLLTPILGTIPVVVFLVLGFFFSYSVALLGSVVTSAVFFAAGSWMLRYSSSFSLYISVIAFLLLILFSFISPFSSLYESHFTLFFEIIVIFVFSFFIFIKNFFRGKILIKNEHIRDFQLIRFDADVYVIKIAVHVAIAHLMIVLVYLLLPSKYHSESLDKLIYFIILYVFITFHFIYEFVHLYLLRKKYLAEEWLPIVDEMGTVHGKVASSISKSSGNKYLHPVIRIALMHKGMLFLKEKSDPDINNLKELDYPFEIYLKYKESLEEGVIRTFEENGGTKTLPSCYLFHYVFKDLKTSRLIYLYVSNIQHLNDSSVNLSNGKWWTRKQIEENLGKGFFSSCFEKEFELLKNTVLNADQLIRDKER